jgi:hypothetical protein
VTFTLTPNCSPVFVFVSRQESQDARTTGHRVLLSGGGDAIGPP